MSTLRLAGLVAPMFAALAHTAAAAEVWSPYKPSGMEYRLMSGVQKYSTAKAICASEGTDASLASPATADAADFVYGMSSSETWLGLSNDMVGRPKPCRDHSVFNWDSGMAFDERAANWRADEPNNKRCKEFCVTFGMRGANTWIDTNCNKEYKFICQRPLTVQVHELQQIVVTQVGTGRSREMENCVNKQMNNDCDTESLSVRKNSAKTMFVIGATVREENPSSTVLTKSGATPMQAECMSQISSALQTCNADGGGVPKEEFEAFTSCIDGTRNGAETGIDCGGNDCSNECSNASNGPIRENLDSGGDPHYVAQLAHGINLCYDVHGTPGDILNLISGKSLLVNSLVVGAKNSVSGTYHGAVGMVAMSPDGSGRRDTLAILADRTVVFNGVQVTGARDFAGVEMVVSIKTGQSVVISFLNSQSVFEISFIKAASEDEAHLDLNVQVQQGLNGTQGIMGQFVHAPASVSPKDDATSILTVNGQTVEVVTRQMPQVSGASGECFKYVDLQASGILKGSVSDYAVEGIFSAPSKFKMFPNGNYEATKVDAYVRATKAFEQERLSKTENAMRMAVESLQGAKGHYATGESLRNTLITLTAKHLGFAVEELQAISNEELAKRAMVQV